MNVHIAPEVLEDSASWRTIDQLLDCFGERRHRLVIADPDAIMASKWLTCEPDSRVTKYNIELIEKLIVDDTYRGASSAPVLIDVTITLTPTREYDLSPKDARRCLEAPLVVVVENERSDGAYIRAMVYAYGRNALAEAYEHGWWKFEHAGGSGFIPQKVDNLLASGTPRFRILVVTESDALIPRTRSSRADKTVEHCTKYHIGIVVLSKREIENYLTDALLSRYAQSRGHLLRMFLRLTPEQRDHYDMKHGFDKDHDTGDATIPEQQAELFGATDNHHRRALIGGFGDCWQLFEDRSGLLSADDLNQRCAHCDEAEIENLLTRIEEHL